MVKQAMKKFRKVLAGTLAALMVISCTEPLSVSADTADPVQILTGDSQKKTEPKTLKLEPTGDLVTAETYMDGMVGVGSTLKYESNKTTKNIISENGKELSIEYSWRIKDGTSQEKAIYIQPKYDGTVQVAGQVGKGRTYQVYAVTGGGAGVIHEYKNETTANQNILFNEIEVKADEKYYFYTVGTGMYIYDFSYTYNEVVENIPATSDIPAFPGAEGGGKYITGGRGQKVYTVTNLEDDVQGATEGSLRWALMQAKVNGGGTIVFNVSGNIELAGSLRFDQVKNVTIAGQTAPGDGITVSGYDTNISNSENIIIRYIRFRPGAINVHSGGDSMDAMWGRDNKGFIIDHCSFSWNTDECLSLYRGEDGTVQWCLVYESLTLSGHSKGRHGYGAIAGGDNVTFHHNLYANHTSRNPRLGGGYAGFADANHVAVVQMSNNIIYNWGFNTAYGGGYTFTNFINNYSIAGPGTRDSVENWVINPGESTKVGGFYINGNYLADYTNPRGGSITPLLTMDNIDQYGRFGGVDSGADKTTLAEEPYTSADSTGPNAGIVNKGFDEFLENGVEAAASTYDEVLCKAGATYPRRDAIDARITAEVADGLGRYVNTEYEVGGFLSPGNKIVESRAVDWDSDGDGMPDAWETENGLNPNDASDADKVTDLSDSILKTAGYTNLEVYLNSIVDMEHEAENPDAEITSPANNEMIAKGSNTTIRVTATANAGTITYADFYYSTLTDITYIGRVNADGSVIECRLPSDIPDGSYFISARVYDSKGNSTQTTAHEVHINTDGTALAEAGWSSQSIGDVDVNGYGSLDNGVLTVKGNGKLGKEEGSISGTSSADATDDAFHYVYREVSGDVEITAKLESISSVDNHAFAGIMVRDDLDADAASAALGLSWTKTDESVGVPWGMYLAGRNVKGGNFDYLGETLDDVGTAENQGVILRPAVKFKDGAAELGYWMRLVRSGNDFTAYCSADGVSWELMGTRTVEMDETIYIGFAAESNRAANEIEQINTARFSNIKINTNIYEVSYDLENIDIAGKPETIAEGNDLVLTLTTTMGYRLPKTVQVTIGDGEPAEVALVSSDPLEGVLTLEKVAGPVKITAKALADTTGIEQVELTEVDEGNYLTVTEENGAIILEQTASTGRITKNAGTDLAVNVSYYVFPKTTDAETMEMDVTILSRTDDTSTDKGLFVGVFEVGNGIEEFSSLGFRNVSGSSDKMGGLTGYWTKSAGNSGNGGSKCNNGLPNDDYHTKPSYELNKTYHVVFEKTNDGYKVSYTGTYADAASGVWPSGAARGTDMDLYKVFSDKRPSETDEVQYGFALIGVTAKIENLKLSDSKGRIIYLQNDAPVSVAEAFEDIEMPVPAAGVNKEDITAKLPGTVNVKYASGTYQRTTVLWDTSILQAVYSEAAVITLTGTVEGAEGLTVTVNVVLQKGTETPDEPVIPDEPIIPEKPDDPEEPVKPDKPQKPPVPSYDDDDSDDYSSDYTKETELTYAEQNLVENVLGADTVVADVVECEAGKLVIGENKEIVFCEENGALSSGKWQKVYDDWYYFGSDSRAAEGWIKPDDKWYYMDEQDKTMKTGWLQTENGQWYLLDEVNGDMKTGWQKRDGKWYLLDEVNGDMKTGWQFRNGFWYLLDTVNGDMKTGWQKTADGKWYYLTEGGAMAANTVTPDGYKVDASGAWIQ